MRRRRRYGWTSTGGGTGRKEAGKGTGEHLVRGQAQVRGQGVAGGHRRQGSRTGQGQVFGPSLPAAALSAIAVRGGEQI